MRARPLVIGSLKKRVRRQKSSTTASRWRMISSLSAPIVVPRACCLTGHKTIFSASANPRGHIFTSPQGRAYASSRTGTGAEHKRSLRGLEKEDSHVAMGTCVLGAWSDRGAARLYEHCRRVDRYRQDPVLRLSDRLCRDADFGSRQRAWKST